MPGGPASSLAYGAPAMSRGLRAPLRAGCLPGYVGGATSATMGCHHGKQSAAKLPNPWHRVQSLVKEPPRLLAVEIIVAVHLLQKAPSLRGESISLPAAVHGKFTLINR